MIKIPKHIGGHANITHIDEGALKWIVETFNVKSMIDVGCGPGGQLEIAKSLNVHCIGIDGDYSLKKRDDLIIHDYTEGKFTKCNDKYDLAWSVEFLEHVEEKYLLNISTTFMRCNYVILTAAPVGKGGYHHVNCKNHDYWKAVFAAWGFSFLETPTVEIRKNSTMKRNFVRENGLFFINNYFQSV